MAVVAAAHFGATKKQAAPPPRRHAPTAHHRPFRPPAARKARPHKQARPHAKPHPKSARVVVQAVGGDCWISVRAGSPAGRVLSERVLLTGQSAVAVARPRLWIRLGAPRNVVLTVGGRRLPGLDTSAPVNLFVGPRGATAAPPGYVPPNGA